MDEFILPEDFNFLDEFDCNELDDMITNRTFISHALTNSITLPLDNDFATNPFALTDQYCRPSSPTNSSKTTSSASMTSLASNSHVVTNFQANPINRETYRESNANVFASDASNSSSAYSGNTRQYKKNSSKKTQSRHPSAKRRRLDEDDDATYDDDESDSESIINSINDQSLRYACNNGPKRRSKLFKITISPRKYDKELTRNHLFDRFRTITKSTVIVAREEFISKYNDSPSNYRATYFFKIFIDLGASDNAMSSVEMHKHVSAFIQEEVGQTEQQFSLEDLVEDKITDEDRVSEISFASVKNRKAALVWASACDVGLRFTPDVSVWDDFSEAYRLQVWCLQNLNKNFDPFHALVLKLKKNEAMKKMLQDFKRAHHIRYKLKRVQTDIPFGDWRDELIRWLNDWIDNGWHPKKQQVLITGPPNAGKTAFIENVLLKGVPSEAILTPEKSSNKYQISNFAWSKSDEVYNSVVYADEFQIAGFDQGKLKVILQGGKFLPQKKFANLKTTDEIQLKITMIFVGNYHFPKSAQDLGIPERFLQIQIPEELPVYIPTGKEPYRVEVFDNHIHVYNSIPATPPSIDNSCNSTPAIIILDVLANTTSKDEITSASTEENNDATQLPDVPHAKKTPEELIIENKI